MIVLTCTTTSAAVIADVHPVWTVIVSTLISPEKRPLAYKNVLHTFLHLSAWSGAVWVHVMLGLTGLALPQQGLILMGIAAAFVLIGWLLSRMPGVVGWQMAAAGLLLWITALLEVYYAPVEAPLALVGGAVVCVAALWVTSSRYWIPLLAGLVSFFMLRYGLPLLFNGLWVVGLLLCVSGLEMIRMFRPQRLHSLRGLYLGVIDWGMGLLWVGTITLFAGLYLVARARVPLTEPLLITALVSAIYSVRQRIVGLPYVALALVGCVLFANLASILSSFDRTYQAMSAIICGLALSAVVIRAACFLLLNRLNWLRRARWLVWWIRPLLTAAMMSHLIGLTMLVVLSPMYSLFKVTPVLKETSTALLAAYTILVYMERRNESWLWFALLLTGGTVALIFAGFGLSQPIWTAFVMGMILLVVSRFSLNWRQMEWIGVAILIGGAGLSLNRTTPISLPNIGAAAVLPSLLIYGFLRGRRVPFTAGAGLLGLGLLFLVVRINPWLLPLACGVVLIGSTLLVEVRRKMVEAWLESCAMRWQAWQ